MTVHTTITIILLTIIHLQIEEMMNVMWLVMMACNDRCLWLVMVLIIDVE